MLADQAMVLDSNTNVQAQDIATALAQSGLMHTNQANLPEDDNFDQQSSSLKQTAIYTEQDHSNSLSPISQITEADDSFSVRLIDLWSLAIHKGACEALPVAVIPMTFFFF